ncbi:MAG: alpha-1,2-fucosyltransferase [Alicyclobacillus sp.]|nr:alpha-1,2-fucosyltransferase [Alicyclobacillus sp.]
MTIYGYPSLERTGLANMLFPWARCMLWCKDHDVPMLAPKWAKLRLGPYLRRERDKRNYQFLFTNKSYISGLHREYVLATYRRITEVQLKDGPFSPNLADPKTRLVVAFSGMKGYFEAFSSRWTEVVEELKKITKPYYREPVLPIDGGGFIGIHVRLGDFRTTTDRLELRRVKNVRIPLDWYVEALSMLRSHLGPVRACVFSDGSDEDLRPILQMPRVQRVNDRSTISELWGMSRSSVLIASGSTFSMWGSFLGQVPAVWYPGQRRSNFLDGDPDGTLLPEWEPGGQDVNETFLSEVERRLDSYHNGTSRR